MNYYNFINCQCSYLTKIYYEATNNTNYLYFIHDKVLLSKSYNEIKADENPWKYQPMIIGSREYKGKSLLVEYIDFLCEKSEIIVEKTNYDFGANHICDGQYLIVSIDDFYHPYSKFYKKTHNDHYVCLRKNDNGVVRYYDSDFPNELRLDKDIFVKMATCPEATIIDARNCRIIELEEYSISFEPNIPFVGLVRCEDVEEQVFLIEALRLSVLFQLIPYCTYMAKEEDRAKGGGGLIQEVIRLSKLANYMLYISKTKKIKQNTYIDIVTEVNNCIERIKKVQQDYE